MSEKETTNVQDMEARVTALEAQQLATAQHLNDALNRIQDVLNNVKQTTDAVRMNTQSIKELAKIMGEVNKDLEAIAKWTNLPDFINCPECHAKNSPQQAKCVKCKHTL